MWFHGCGDQYDQQGPEIKGSSWAQIEWDSKKDGLFRIGAGQIIATSHEFFPPNGGGEK